MKYATSYPNQAGHFTRIKLVIAGVMSARLRRGSRLSNIPTMTVNKRKCVMRADLLCAKMVES